MQVKGEYTGSIRLELTKNRPIVMPIRLAWNGNMEVHHGSVRILQFQQGSCSCKTVRQVACETWLPVNNLYRSKVLSTPGRHLRNSTKRAATCPTALRVRYFVSMAAQPPRRSGGVRGELSDLAGRKYLLRRETGIIKAPITRVHRLQDVPDQVSYDAPTHDPTKRSYTACMSSATCKLTGVVA